MTPISTENLQHLALDGPLAWPIVAAAAAALLAMFAWTLRREASLIGRRSAVLFFLLRGGALGVVLWMLLAPTSVRVQRSTIRKSVSVVTDISRSMSTVDPAGTADEMRWALSASSVATATAAADAASAAAGVAERRLRRAAAAIREHRAESAVRDESTAASKAMGDARRNVERVVERIGSWDSDEGPAAEATEAILAAADRIQKLLDGPEFDAFAELAHALERGRTPSQKGWRESLPDLEHRLAGIRRRLAELASLVSEGERDLLMRKHPQLVAAMAAASRRSRVAGWVENLNDNVFKELRDKADVRYSSFGEKPALLLNQTAPGGELGGQGEPTSSQQGMKTNLSAVLEQLIRDQQQQPVAAVFLPTDVIHNDLDSPDPRELAAELRGTPIYVVPIGSARHVRDIVLQSVLAPTIAMRNDDVVIEASLQAFDCAGETCTVALIQDGEVLEQQAVDFDSEAATRTVRFERRMSDVGLHQFQLSIAPLAGELTDEKNFDDFEVNVTRSEIKILLADEIPRWEYGYLTRLFRRAEKIECDELLFRPRMIATGKRAETRGFPITVDEWDYYDVVILGDLPPEHLPVAAQESLVEFLRERGGTLVLIAGQEFMPQAYARYPLGEILPVQEAEEPDNAADQLVFHVTERGREHDALMIAETAEASRLAWDFVNRNVPLHSLSRHRRPLPTARTLIGAAPQDSADPEAASQRSAFLCWQPVKRGRIVYLSGPETYRLRFLRGDRLHYRLWGQMLRWAVANELAAGSERVRVRTGKSRYKKNETVQVVVRLSDAQGAPVLDAAFEAVATRGDGQRFTISLAPDEEIPGQYRGEMRQPEPGVYRVEPSGAAVDDLIENEEQRQAATSSFTVRADLPMELRDTRCDLALAHQIADATGGQVLPPTAVEQIVALTDLEPEVIEEVDSEPLWVQWKFLWIVFGCLQTEWIIRKWRGLS